jgi:hypothetical protein
MLKRYLYLPLAVAIGATNGKRPKRTGTPASSPTTPRAGNNPTDRKAQPETKHVRIKHR